MYVFSKRLGMKLWRYLFLSIWKRVEERLDISGPIQGKILTNQERFPLMFRCPN